MTAGGCLRIGWRARVGADTLERWAVVAREDAPELLPMMTADGVEADHEVRVAVAGADGAAAGPWTRTRPARLAEPGPELAADEPGDWTKDEARIAAAPAADREVRTSLARAVATGAIDADDAIAVLAALATALDRED